VTVLEKVIVVGQLVVVVAETRGQFENPEEGKCLPLKSNARGLVTAQWTMGT
jgi:hypothetical protein